MSSPHPASRHRRRLTGSHNDKPPIGICRTYHPTDAHCESQEKMAKMAVELKDTADHCRLLEKENQAKATDLEKATMANKHTRSAMRAKKEELREVGDIAAGKPFILRRKFGDP